MGYINWTPITILLLMCIRQAAAASSGVAGNTPWLSAQSYSLRIINEMKKIYTYNVCDKKNTNIHPEQSAWAKEAIIIIIIIAVVRRTMKFQLTNNDCSHCLFLVICRGPHISLYKIDKYIAHWMIYIGKI